MVPMAHALRRQANESAEKYPERATDVFFGRRGRLNKA